MGKYIGK